MRQPTVQSRKSGDAGKPFFSDTSFHIIHTHLLTMHFQQFSWVDHTSFLPCLDNFFRTYDCRARCCFNTLLFTMSSQMTPHISPIMASYGVCLHWLQTLICILTKSLHGRMQYYVIPDRIITTPYCICLHTSSYIYINIRHSWQCRIIEHVHVLFLVTLTG